MASDTVLSARTVSMVRKRLDTARASVQQLQEFHVRIGATPERMVPGWAMVGVLYMAHIELREGSDPDRVAPYLDAAVSLAATLELPPSVGLEKTLIRARDELYSDW
jgi:hypothetical protein